MTEDEVATKDVIALHKQGLTSPEIAARLNVSPQLVRAYLRRAGFKPITIVEEKDIIALHNEGLSPSEIALRVNTSPQYITRCLRDAGLKPHPHPVWREAKERIRDMLTLHEEGLSANEIAETLDLSPVTVRKRLREAGLAPQPGAEEARNTLRELDEIVRLGKQHVPRHEIAKRIGSTWPLVAEALEKTSVKPVWPACEELGTWASSLLPIVDEIKKAHPDSEPILRKVNQLEKELGAIIDATWTVQHRLPFKEKEAEKERWCIAPISQAIKSNLVDYIEPLKECVKQLDVAKLPKKIEQAETCVYNLTDAMSRTVSHIPEVQEAMTKERPKTATVHSSEEELSEMSADHELLLHFGAEEFCSPGLVLSEARARATPCTCFTYKDRHYCWSKGVIGLLKPEQQEVYCVAGKEYKAQPRLVERFTSFAEAAEAAHKKIEAMPKGRERLETWLTAMGEELSKRGITV